MPTLHSCRSRSPLTVSPDTYVTRCQLPEMSPDVRAPRTATVPYHAEGWPSGRWRVLKSTVPSGKAGWIARLQVPDGSGHEAFYQRVAGFICDFHLKRQFQSRSLGFSGKRNASLPGTAQAPSWSLAHLRSARSQSPGDSAPGGSARHTPRSSDADAVP